MITAAKNQVTTGCRSCAGASNSTGIPKKAAIDFHHSSGGALSNSEPRACSLRFWFRKWPASQRLGFAGIEPDEFANSTDFDLDSAAAVEGDLDHCVPAGWTRPCAASFVVNCVQPKRVDRFRSEGTTQQLQTGRAAITFFATPNDTVAGAHFRQRNAAGRTEEFSVHQGIMSQTKRAIDNLEASYREPSSVAAAVSAAKGALQRQTRKGSQSSSLHYRLAASLVWDWPFSRNFIK